MKKTFILILVVICISCNQEIAFELPFRTDIVLVNGIYTPYEPMKVQVNYSRAAEDTTLKPIVGLDIRLYENDILLEYLNYEGDGIYSSSSPMISGNIFKIEFEHEGNLIWAVDTMPLQVEIDSVAYYSPHEVIDFYMGSLIFYPISFYVNDIPYDEPAVSLHMKGEIFNFIPPDWWFTEDTMQVNFYGNNSYNMETFNYFFPKEENLYCFLTRCFWSDFRETLFDFTAMAYLQVHSSNLKRILGYDYNYPQNTNNQLINDLHEPFYGFDSNIEGDNAYGFFFSYVVDSIAINYKRDLFLK